MTWNDISLSKYNEIMELVLDTEMAEEDKTMYLIQILFGVDAYKINMAELRGYMAKLPNLSAKIPNMKIKDRYTLNGNEYRISKELKDWTVAQWIDWNAYIKNGTDPKNFAQLLSVFFIPTTAKEYGEGYNTNDVANDISVGLMIPDAISIMAFFLTYRKALLIRSLSSMLKQTLRTKKISLKTKIKILIKTIKGMWVVATGE